MEAHHASLGRRTLEEIRQKRAAERLQKASSGSESEFLNNFGGNRSDSGSRIGERDTYVLQSRIKELESRNAELEKENHFLLSQLKEKEVENDSLLKRLNDLEHNSLPSLRKALNDVSLEKDAATVAKEDALSQLRTIKKRLKEAEEEQYRAEEDAAALRAELNSLQQQNLGNPYGNISTSNLEEQVLAMEKEIMNLKSELQQESTLRQHGQHKLIEEQVRASSLAAEKQDLEDKLLALSKKVSDEESEAASHKAFSLESKKGYLKKTPVFRLVIKRHWGVAVQWENQALSTNRGFLPEKAMIMQKIQTLVKHCLKQNEELRGREMVESRKKQNT
ncbi:uncharacterized protein A4U43_C08F36070 [Asparagus officinalis]|nr:uncharacterized protein A4U43_C08F36070 [Asparagus officinalis]